MASYDKHISQGEVRVRCSKNDRKSPIDYVAIEERRYERIHLSQWLSEPVRHNKIKPLRLR